MSKPDSIKNILVLRQGNTPQRWVDEALRRVGENPNTSLVDQNQLPDVVLLITSNFIYEGQALRQDVIEMMKRYPLAALLIISPDQIEHTIRIRDFIEKPKHYHLPFVGGSAEAIIQALIDMEIISKPKPLWQQVLKRF